MEGWKWRLLFIFFAGMFVGAGITLAFYQWVIPDRYDSLLWEPGLCFSRNNTTRRLRCTV